MKSSRLTRPRGGRFDPLPEEEDSDLSNFGKAFIPDPLPSDERFGERGDVPYTVSRFGEVPLRLKKLDAAIMALVFCLVVIPVTTIFGTSFRDGAPRPLYARIGALPFLASWIVFTPVTFGAAWVMMKWFRRLDTDAPWPVFSNKVALFRALVVSVLFGVVLARFAGIARRWETFPWWIAVVVGYFVVFHLAAHTIHSTPYGKVAHRWSVYVAAFVFALVLSFILTKTSQVSTDTIIMNGTELGTVVVVLAAILLASQKVMEEQRLVVRVPAYLWTVVLVILSGYDGWFFLVTQAVFVAAHLFALSRYGVTNIVSEAP